MHLKTLHYEEDNVCDQCDKIFNSKNDKIMHINSKHAVKKDGKFECSICREAVFPSQKYLRNHIKYKHFAIFIQCPHCDRNFQFQSQLKEHLVIAHDVGESLKIKCEECGEEFKTKKQFRSHKHAVHDKRPDSICPHCGKSFLAKAIKTHIKNVHGEGLHFCEECGKSFKSQAHLKSHIKQVHTQKETLICPYEECKKPCNGKAALNSHVRTVHIGLSKNHKCKFCPKMFVCPSDARRHERATHTFEKPYECKQCDYKCADSMRLKKHIESIHQNIMYDCDYLGCTKSYNDRGNLYAHRWRVHKIPRPKQKFE